MFYTAAQGFIARGEDPPDHDESPRDDFPELTADMWAEYGFTAEDEES